MLEAGSDCVDEGRGWEEKEMEWRWSRVAGQIKLADGQDVMAEGKCRIEGNALISNLSY